MKKLTYKSLLTALVKADIKCSRLVDEYRAGANQPGNDFLNGPRLDKAAMQFQAIKGSAVAYLRKKGCIS
jgi:hypothetical protein